MGIPGMNNRCVVAAKEGQTCNGWDESSHKPFPACASGLSCVMGYEASIPGAESTCMKVAEEGQTCEGFDERTKKPFPSCNTGLACKPLHHGMMHIPGAGNHCVYAQEGEPCQGFDESTGKPHADCEDDLVCMKTAEVSIFGGKTCVDLQ
jgi:hypothetical protein